MQRIRRGCSKASPTLLDLIFGAEMIKLLQDYKSYSGLEEPGAQFTVQNLVFAELIQGLQPSEVFLRKNGGDSG